MRKINGIVWAAIFCVSFIAAGAGAGAQEEAVEAREGKEPLKIGCVDMGKIFEGYEGTKNLDLELKRIESEKKAQKQELIKEIKKLKEEVKFFSDNGKAEKQKEIEIKVKELQNFDFQLRQELTQERRKKLQAAMAGIESAIREYGEGNHYDLILNSVSFGGLKNVYYAKEGLDLSDKVIDILNMKYESQKPETRNQKPVTGNRKNGKNVR